MSDILARTAKAIHTLFFANEQANERYEALQKSLSNDDERIAFDALHIGLINFEPPPPEVLAGLQARAVEIEAAEAEAMDAGPDERIAIEAPDTDEGRYIKRLLEKMYAGWDGTLKYEHGRHRFVHYSPFDEQLRRHTCFAHVSVGGNCPDLTVRSYVLGPYLRVVDHRTGLESDEPWRILGGDLTPILPLDEVA